VLTPEENVFRLLHLEGDLEYYEPAKFLLQYRKNQRANSAAFEKVIAEFNPDILFFWGMWAMSKALAAQAERIMPSRIVYYLSDYWPANKDRHTIYWENPPSRRFLQGPKKILKYYALSVLARDANPQLKLQNTVTVSKAVKDILVEANLPLQNAKVIHGGTDINRFDHFVERDFASRPLKLLYAGQLVPHKGVHTAIEAMSRLVHGYGIHQVHLSIVGSGHPKYEEALVTMVKKEGLEAYVEIVGPVSKDAMPGIMQQHSVLVFPSIYEEPFARMTQEAMLSGMVVVGTPTGGTKEILMDGRNGLIFPAEDSASLAGHLRSLADSPQLCRQLAAEARQTVLENYTLDKMVNEIETYLVDVFECHAQI
jgi:glycosyltransferase involved in cell wall biosynthesis